MAERNGAGSSKPVIEELQHRSDQVYISLVVNRRQRSARIVDFIAGNFAAKQAAIQQIGVREKIDRVFTLVEREESVGWSRVGYAREGSVPGYYKRSDAYVMGHIIRNPPVVLPDGSIAPPVADAAGAERTLVSAKKLKDGIVTRGLRAQAITEGALSELKAASVKQRRPAEVLAERFGRTGPRVHVLAQSKTATRGGGNVVSAELQECFGNACVQLGMIPSREDDMRYLTAALLGLNEQLKAREVSSTFAFAPATDVLTSAAMLAAGYRKTGLLAQHLLLDTKRVDAILWTRRTGATSDAADAA